MFGYTIPMEPMMRSEEVAAYRGYYCETCHQLRDGYGVMSTIIVSYEMTFANLVLNSVLDDGEIIKVPDTGRFCVFRRFGIWATDAALTASLCANDVEYCSTDGQDDCCNCNIINDTHNYTLRAYSALNCLFFLRIIAVKIAATARTITQPTIGIQMSPKLPPVKRVPKKNTKNPIVYPTAN